MHKKGKDNCSYNFIPSKGLGKISFSLSVNKIFQILGKPNKQEKDIEILGLEETTRLIYDDIGIIISKSMYEGVYENICIFCSKIYLDNVNLFELTKNDLITFIENYHLKNSMKFDYTYEEINKEIFINFFNLGLSVWLDNMRVSDICIEKPSYK